MTAHKDCPEFKGAIAIDAAGLPTHIECANCHSNERPFEDWALHLPMAEVTSSNVRRIGYDAGLSVVRVDFNNGGRYAMLDVPEEAYQAFKAATGDYGGHYARNMRGRFKAVKLTPEQPKPKA